MSELTLPDQPTVTASADLLAHWWSRPVVAEVAWWLGAAEIEAHVRRQFAGDAGPGDGGPGNSGPGDHGPADHGPGDHRPADHRPGDHRPGDHRPGDHRPGDHRPGDGGPGGGRLCYGADQVPALLDEYERLFVGPGQVPCPPYESFWRDDVQIDLWHSLMGPCTADLRKLYREIGIDLNPAAGELPDHVAVEFEALAYALSHPEGGRVARALVTGHLGQWLPRLCRAVAREAQHPYYSGLAAVTVDWLGHIQRHLAPPADTGPG